MNVIFDPSRGRETAPKPKLTISAHTNALPILMRGAEYSDCSLEFGLFCTNYVPLHVNAFASQGLLELLKSAQQPAC